MQPFLFVFLWRVSLPRISNVLEKRERKINEDLSAAKELQVEASKIQEQVHEITKLTISKVATFNVTDDEIKKAVSSTKGVIN